MPQIAFKPYKFSGKWSHLNKDYTHTFRIQDLLRSIVRVGKRNHSDLAKYGYYSKMEMQYKIAIILANTKISSSNLMLRGDVYKLLDPSEKTNISYYLGLAFSHLLSESILRIAWLMHLDVYHKGYNIKYNSSRSKSRPDLFGQDALGDWVVIESKGRSNSMELGLLNIAKDQTRRIHSISHGLSPVVSKRPLKIASVTHFIGNRLTVNWMDPDESDDDAETIEVVDSDFFREYYRSVISVIGGVFDDKQPSRLGQFYIEQIDDLGNMIGVHISIYNAYMLGEFDSIKSLCQNMYAEEPKLSENASLGMDGIIFIMGDGAIELLLRKDIEIDENSR